VIQIQEEKKYNVTKVIVREVTVLDIKRLNGICKMTQVHLKMKSSHVSIEREFQIGRFLSFKGLGLGAPTGTLRSVCLLDDKNSSRCFLKILL